MASTLTLKPARPDLIVRNPEGGFAPLARDGETVADTDYWRRRLRDGDVIEIKALEKPKKPAA